MPKSDSNTDYPSGLVEVLCGRSGLPVPPGKILAATIEQIGVCPSKLAEMLGIHRNTIIEFILGDQPISAEMGDRIGDALGIDDRQWAKLQQKMVAKSIH